MDTQIDAIYEPKDGKPDHWKLERRLSVERRSSWSKSTRGEESPILASIQASAGEHLLRARCIIFKDLESKESLRSELNDALADELCEAMSRYCRTPAVRFFNSLLILKKALFRGDKTPRTRNVCESSLDGCTVSCHGHVFCFLARVMQHVNQPSERTLRQKWFAV